MNRPGATPIQLLSRGGRVFGTLLSGSTKSDSATLTDSEYVHVCTVMDARQLVACPLLQASRHHVSRPFPSPVYMLKFGQEIAGKWEITRLVSEGGERLGSGSAGSDVLPFGAQVIFRAFEVHAPAYRSGAKFR